MSKTKVAVIGSGNIGTDLMIKILRNSQRLEMGAMVGIDLDSDGLARARRMGVQTTHEGVDGLMALPDSHDIEIFCAAPSPRAHGATAATPPRRGRRLTPPPPPPLAPYPTPAVNIDDHLDAPNVNMVTCGGQA